MISLIAALAAVAQAAPANPNHRIEAPWAQAFKANNERHFFNCMGKQQLSSCEALVAGTHAAYDPVASDPVIQHIVLPQLFNYYRVLAERQIAARQFSKAAETTSRGMKLVIEHYDDGKHAHALIDGIGLFDQRGQALIGVGKREEAFATFRQGDQVATMVVESYEKANPRPAPDSRPWKAAGLSLRMGSELNESWAKALTETPGLSEAQKKANSLLVAERLAKAMSFTDGAIRHRFSWVDREYPWVRYARLGLWRAAELGQAGRHADARTQLAAIQSIVAFQEKEGDSNDRAFVPGLKSRIVTVRQNLCLLDTLARRDTEAALLCQ